MSKGIGAKYLESLSDSNREDFINSVYHLYIEENHTIKETSDLLCVDFNIIRYIVRTNIDGRFQKSKEKRYEVIIDHMKRTNDERYNGHPMKSEAVKEKLRNTFYEKYGVYHNHQIGKDIRDIETIHDRDKFIELIYSIEEGSRTVDKIMELSGYSRTPVLGFIKKYELENIIDWGDNPNHPEAEIISFVKRNIGDIEIISHYHGWSKKSPRYEIDLYFPDYNLGIEFNGIYYHQVKYRGNMYHQEKSLDALDSNIFIYYIWENDWYNPIKRKIIESQISNLLNKSRNRIYARDCLVKYISPRDSGKFLNNNHLQGSRGAKYHLGLFYNDELVSVMTFGDNYFIRKNHDIELLRFASKINTVVVGGASKLFTHFIRDNKNIDKIISYCSIDTGSGKTYKNLGFELLYITPPNYFWVDRETGKTITRYQAQKMDEYSMRNNDRYFSLSNSGNYKFEWRRGQC